MANLTAIPYKDFVGFVNSLNVGREVDTAFLYRVFELAIGAIDDLLENGILDKHTFVNQYDVICYLLGEYLYSIPSDKKEDIEAFQAKNNIQESMASVTADKYISLSALKHTEIKVINPYLPPISSLDVYTNFMLRILQGYEHKDPQSTLITDLLTKSISIIQCIIKLLVNGYETEALASWRTLHECECSLILLDRYKEPLINSYLKHMRYGIAYKDGIQDKAAQDQLFVQLKAEMKELDLKSKDMKKYIEYGWLLPIKEVREDPLFKYNFRDGLEKVAGLEGYSETYQLSSEILHSTPLLIYSNKEYFYYLTLLSTYESFFRLEKVFTSLFVTKVNQEQFEHYQRMRSIYYSQLVNIHKRESIAFTNLNNKKA